MEPPAVLTGDERRTVFVTGATGFVGGALVPELLARGLGVRALVRRDAPLPEGVAAVRGDLEDVDAFAASLRGADAVVHAAALLDPIDDAEAGERVNHRATLALARAAAAAGVRTFVFVSSIAAIGFRPGAGLVGPQATCTPTTVYGRTKRRAEEGLLGWRPAGMRIAVVRPPTVYGAGEHGNFLALARAIDRHLFLVPGRGDNRMSFCHVHNLAAALALVVDEPRAEGVLHVADAEPVTLRRVADTLARALGRRPPRLPFPMPVARAVARTMEAVARPFHVTPPLSPGRLTTLTSDFALDCSRLEALGFRAPMSFERGVRETVAFYRREGRLS